MLNNYICALDIGSSKIAACVAQVKRGRINSIFFESTPSKGVKGGAIVDSNDLIECVTKLMRNLKAKSGVNIKFLYTNISGQDIVSKHSRAIVPLAERGSKVITISDIERVNEQARILASNLEEEIIHFLPYTYTIDSKNKVINPLGLCSHSLEVDLYLICGKLSSIHNLGRIINQSGYEIKKLFFSGLATSQAVFGDEFCKDLNLNPSDFSEGVNLFCDIGSDTTELLIFRDGLLKDVEILSIGGNDLTLQLEDSLKIPFELAEDIKRSYGVIGDCQKISEDKEILIKKSDLYKPIKQRQVCEIVTSRAKSICSAIKDAIEKKVPFYELDNFIIAGRSTRLEGFIETLEHTLDVHVKLGRINSPQILSLIKENNKLSGPKYLTYLTALGMVAAVRENRSVGFLPLNHPAKNLFLKAANRFKEVYQEYF